MILTNEHRHYLGLSLIAPDWDIVPFNEEKTLVFDGNIIRKVITNRAFLKTYHEEDVEVETAENRSIVLPKTSKGKPKKLNSTITESFTTIGVYFSYTEYNIIIASHTSQHSFFTERHDDMPFEMWFEAWKNNFTQADFQALETFKNQPRTYQKKYKEGDVFRFKIWKNRYGFGKIILNVIERRKDENFKKNKNYGLNQLMGTALIVKVYHKISDSQNIDIQELENCQALPVQPIMDNSIFYNEFPIIGNLPVSDEERNDFITMSRSISLADFSITYLQCGLNYAEIPLKEYKKHEKEHWKNYRNEAIGTTLQIETLEACIKANSNEPYFANRPYGLHLKKVEIQKPWSCGQTLVSKLILKQKIQTELLLVMFILM